MSSKQIGIEEARKTLGDLVTAAQQGVDIILTRNGKPAARITRYQEDTMTIATAIIDRLNAYTGDDVWQDVILGLDEYDEEATDAIDRGASDRFALADGTVIRYDGQTSRWYEVH